MKSALKKCVIYLFHIVTRVFCMLPIRSHIICFEAFMGNQYSCNPKYICEYIEANTDRFKMIWVYNKDKIPCKYKQIKRNTFTYFYYMLTAGTVIFNSGKNKLLKFRKEQIVINTWHGGGAYKKEVCPKYDEHYRDKDYFISSCAMASTFVIKEGQNFHGDVLEYGLPRNDIIVNFHKEKIGKIKKSIGVSDKKCVLYAPTFREDRALTDFGLDYSRLIENLKIKFGYDWVVLYRGHYHMVERDDRDLSDIFVNVTKYPDMQELLMISDVLITDYSSSVWDYSFLQRPIFLYATDLEEYYRERSFYVDIHDWPCQLCQNNDELEDAIINYNQEDMERKIDKHHKYMGSYETGHACEKTYRFICDKLK